MNIFILLFVFQTLIVWGIEQCISSSTSYIIRSGVYPNCANALSATHFFELQLRRRSLLQLVIEIPDYIHSVGKIEVVDQQFKVVDAEVSVTPNKASICFCQYIEPGNRLTILLKEVRTYDRVGRVWHYLIYGKLNSITSLILLGVARIRTYKSV